MREPSLATYGAFGSPSLVSWTTDSTTGRAEERRSQAARIAAMKTPAAPTAIHVQRLGDAGIATASVGALPESDSASRAKARSDAEWKRCSGFFSRQRCTTLCRAGGMPGAICETEG